MPITHLSSVSQLEKILSQSKDKLSVIDFHATWCGPCHAIAPTFEALSKQYENVNFLKCDVDSARDVAQLYNVTAMPTFVFLKGGDKVHQIRGADRRALEDAVRQYSSSGTAAFSGKGQTLGGTGSSSTPPTSDGVTNLSPQIKIFLGLVGAYVIFWYFS